MTPTVACPGCGSTLPAPPHLAGQTVQCGRCSRSFTLPRAALDAVPVRPTAPRPRPAESDEEDERPVRRRKRKPKASGVPVWIWATMAGLVVLLMVGVGLLVYALSKHGGVTAGTDGSRDSTPANSVTVGAGGVWTRTALAKTPLSAEVPPLLDPDSRGNNVPASSTNGRVFVQLTRDSATATGVKIQYVVGAVGWASEPGTAANIGESDGIEATLNSVRLQPQKHRW